MKITFCERSKLRAMEQETLDFAMEGDDIDKYTTRFYELARLGPARDEPESEKLERYIGGLSPKIRMLVTPMEPDTMSEAIHMARKANEHIAHTKTIGNNNNSDRNNNNGHNNKRMWDHNQGGNVNLQPSKRHEVAQAYAAGLEEKKGYFGILPKCEKFQSHHNPGRCPIPCRNCKKIGHYARDCKLPIVAKNQKPPATCFGCGEVGHYKNGCPKKKDQKNENQGGITREGTYIIRRGGFQVISNMKDDNNV